MLLVILMLKKIINITILAIYFLITLVLIITLRKFLTIGELIGIVLFLLFIAFLFVYLFKKNVWLFISYPCVILVIIFLFTFNLKTNKVVSFVSDVTSYENLVDNYRLISLKEKYDQLKDLDNKKIGYTRELLNYESFKIKFEAIHYPSFEELIKALDEEKIDAAIILERDYESINSGKYTIISKIGFVEEIVPASKTNFDNTSLIYISSVDNENSFNLSGQSDINIVLGINNKTKQILLLIIPRDYYVFMPSKNANDKISHASIYGINEAIKTIENLLENEIDYYLKIDFKVLEETIDKLSGIDVESEYSFISSGVEFKKGWNHLNGHDALIFARDRNSFVGDRTTAENQEKVLEALFKKMLSDDEYLEILDVLKKLIQTNIPEKSLLGLIKDQFIYNYDWSISRYLLNGIDSYEYTYTYKCCKLLVIKPDLQTVYNAMTSIEYLKNDGIFN